MIWLKDHILSNWASQWVWSGKWATSVYLVKISFEKFLIHINEEALTKLSETCEYSEQAMVFKQADDAYKQQLMDKSTHKMNDSNVDKVIRCMESRKRNKQSTARNTKRKPQHDSKALCVEVVNENGNEYEPDCLKMMLPSQNMEPPSADQKATGYWMVVLRK